MPHYTFVLKDGSGGIEDRTGVHLPDPERAFEYAQGVAHELMQGREVQTRCWRLDVLGDEGRAIFEIPFATVDRSLEHLPPELRQAVIEANQRRRALHETWNAARRTVLESRALVARSRGKPYLASYLGEPTMSQR